MSDLDAQYVAELQRRRRAQIDAYLSSGAPDPLEAEAKRPKPPPAPEELGVMQEFGRGVARGSMQMAGSVGTLMKMSGVVLNSDSIQWAGETVAKYWAESAEPYTASAAAQGSVWDNPALALSPNFLAASIGETIPSIAAAMVPGIGAARGINVAGRMLKWSPDLVLKLARFGAAASGGAVGGLLEGSSTYETVKARGGNDTDAITSAALFGLAAAGLNAVGLDRMFGAKGGVAKRFLTGGATESLTEWLEEPTEAYILGDDVAEAMKRGFNVVPATFITGGLGGALAGERPERKRKPGAPGAGAPTEAPGAPAAGPGAPVTPGPEATPAAPAPGAPKPAAAPTRSVLPTEEAPRPGADVPRGTSTTPTEAGPIVPAAERTAGVVPPPPGLPPDATIPTVSVGTTVSAQTERGLRIDAAYAIVEADRLVSSERPEYPGELQPRDRSRAASDLQVQRLANRLEPAFLGASPSVSTGAPIVGPDGVVESGNGRLMALRRVYEQPDLSDRANDYKAWLADHAPEFGLNPEAIERADKPVLVRVRVTPVDRTEFTRQANEQAVAAMSTTEQAMSDAKRLSPNHMALLVPTESGDVGSAGNRQFIRAFMRDVAGPTEAGSLVGPEGELSQSGVTRIRNAIFAKAYGCD